MLNSRTTVLHVYSQKCPRRLAEEVISWDGRMNIFTFHLYQCQSRKEVSVPLGCCYHQKMLAYKTQGHNRQKEARPTMQGQRVEGWEWESLACRRTCSPALGLLRARAQGVFGEAHWSTPALIQHLRQVSSEPTVTLDPAELVHLELSSKVS